MGKASRIILVCAVVLVGLSQFSYGEATLFRTCRLNWWSGQVSFMWGQRGGASRSMLSLDEWIWDGWSCRNTILPSFDWEAARGRVASPVWLLATPVVLTCLLVMWRKKRNFDGCCPSCGYPLTDLPTNTCPECGGTIKTPA